MWRFRKILWLSQKIWTLIENEGNLGFYTSTCFLPRECKSFKSANFLSSSSNFQLFYTIWTRNLIQYFHFTKSLEPFSPFSQHLFTVCKLLFQKFLVSSYIYLRAQEFHLNLVFCEIEVSLAESWEILSNQSTSKLKIFR